MQTQPEFAIYGLQSCSGLHIKTADGGERGQLADIVAVADHRRICGSIVEHEKLYDELNVANATTTVLQIEAPGIGKLVNTIRDE